MLHFSSSCLLQITEKIVLVLSFVVTLCNMRGPWARVLELLHQERAGFASSSAKACFALSSDLNTTCKLTLRSQVEADQTLPPCFSAFPHFNFSGPERLVPLRNKTR